MKLVSGTAYVFRGFGKYVKKFIKFDKMCMKACQGSDFTVIHNLI